MFIAFNETRVRIKRILRNKFKVTLLTTILVFGFFLFFQLLYVQLPSDTSVDNLKSKVGGVRHTNLRLETPDTIQDILVHKKNLEHWDVSSVNKQPQSEENILKYSKMLNTKSRNSFYVRGGKRSEYHLYRPNVNGNFECFTTGMEIDPSKINDDYCDCEEDGSDEPGTSACQNGRFHCNTQLASESIPSHRVNDGICDCCDGSDEWAVKRLHFRLAENTQKHLGRYQSPCTNLCPNK